MLSLALGSLSSPIVMGREQLQQHQTRVLRRNGFEHRPLKNEVLILPTTSHLHLLVRKGRGISMGGGRRGHVVSL